MITLVLLVPALFGHVLGRAADRSRARDGNLPARLDPEREPPPLAVRQARPGRSDQPWWWPAWLSLMVTWWSSPLDKVNQNRFSPATFGLHGFVPAGYAALRLRPRRHRGASPPPHFARHGGDAGRLHRRSASSSPTGSGRTSSARSRSIPLSQAAVGFEARSRDAPSGGRERSRSSQCVGVERQRDDAAGHAPTAAFVKALCPRLGQGPPAGSNRAPGRRRTLQRSHLGAELSQQAQQVFTQCIDRLSGKYHVVVTYQPANRFWTFQTIETALFVVVSALLGRRVRLVDPSPDPVKPIPRQ